jgi:hypothetical protein
MFTEDLIKAKVRSITPAGTIREVSELHWLTLSQVTKEVKNIWELRETLKTNPWDIIVYANPENLKPEDIFKQIEKEGSSTLARIIIRKQSK